MAPGAELLNLVRNCYSSCLSLMPEGVRRYATQHMDTIPKFLTHTVTLMAICNIFLLFSSVATSFLTVFAAFLLALQTASVWLTTTPFGQSVAPQLFNPTEFMLGVCIGITIGGIILSFFLCLAFGRIHAYCSHHPDGPDSCGWRTASLNGVWWWSSCIFWLDFICCFLLLLGHRDISTPNIQYQSLDQQDQGSMGSNNFGNMSQQPSYNQYQEQPAFAQQSYNSGGYNDVPDVKPSSNSSSQDDSHPLQGNTLRV